MSNMIRQIMALFDEYQSKENAKHTLRAMKENARQGFWNGALPPIGYRIMAGEQRGHRTKKTLEIDPFQAETVRLIFRLAWEDDCTSGPMGIKSITKHLNSAGIRTRDGGRWGIDAVHKVLTRTTYVRRVRGRSRFASRRPGSSCFLRRDDGRWPGSAPRSIRSSASICSPCWRLKCRAHWRRQYRWRCCAGPSKQ